MHKSPSALPSAVFLDRDGVVNEEVGIVRRKEQLSLISGSGDAISRLNGAGVPVVVITNQPVVARGWATEEDVKSFHGYLGKLLEANGARIDKFYFCPHHENANLRDYRMVCECRKPKPGMLIQASSEMQIDLRKAIMIGDRTVDLKAGKEAGCEAFLVKTGFAGKDGKCDQKPDRTFDDLSAAVDFILTDK